MLWQTDFYAGSVSPQGCDQEAYDPYCAFNAHPGEYVELQNGPAASQRHSFPLDAHSTYEWTEYLAAFDGNVKKLQDKDYSVANAEVRPLLNSISRLTRTLHSQVVQRILMLPKAHKLYIVL